MERTSLANQVAATAQTIPPSGGCAGADIEEISKWLHDETAHPEGYPNRTWPETDRDDGQREGGFVKIVPQHAQAYFRDIARRLVARFALPLPPSAAVAGEPVQGPCRYCNGTKRALYFSEQGWSQEWRDCHVCRPLLDREAVIEECAKIADAIAEGAATPNGKSRAELIASRIRALASPVSQESK